MRHTPTNPGPVCATLGHMCCVAPRSSSPRKGNVDVKEGSRVRLTVGGDLNNHGH